MSTPIENEEVWKSIVADPEVRACLRRVAMSVLSEISPESIEIYRSQVETYHGLVPKYKARIDAIDSEIGCLDVLVEKLPLEGEGGAFRGMLVQKKAALMVEKEETIKKAEEVPGQAEPAERLLRTVEIQVANASFLMRVIEDAEDAEGGIHRVDDEPRGPGDHGPAPDSIREV